MKHDTLRIVSAGVGVAALIALGAYYHRLRARRMENVFVLIVTMQVKPEHVEEFRRRWAILAAFCAANEPRTLTYELVAGENANEFVVYERYITKEDLTEVHHKSAEFLAFGEWMRTNDVVVSKTRWMGYETGYGFVSKCPAGWTHCSC